jgi:hypothetical protein
MHYSQMGGMCSPCGRDEKRIEILIGKSGERNHLKDLRVNGSVLLNLP